LKSKGDEKMRYNRNESFRFSFRHPLKARFSIDELNGKKVESGEGEIQIMDLSPSGTKIRTDLNLPMSEDPPVKIVVHFELNEEEYNFKGKIVWKKMHLNSFLYGVHFLINDDMHEEIIKQLKKYVKINPSAD